MTESRRRFNAEFKFEVALEAAKGIKTLDQLSGQFGVDPDQISEWKRELLENGPAIFSTPAEQGHRAVEEDQPLASIRRAFREQLDALSDRRKRFSKQDAAGRSTLFYAAEMGLEEEVREIIFAFRGTGMFPPRLALITQKDANGLTAADVAEQNGHEEIARLLRSEEGRMEYFE